MRPGPEEESMSFSWKPQNQREELPERLLDFSAGRQRSLRACTRDRNRSRDIGKRDRRVQRHTFGQCWRQFAIETIARRRCVYGFNRARREMPRAFALRKKSALRAEFQNHLPRAEREQLPRDI